MSNVQPGRRRLPSMLRSLAALSALTAAVLTAQPRTVEGHVVDSVTGAGIPSVTVTPRPSSVKPPA